MSFDKQYIEEQKDRFVKYLYKSISLLNEKNVENEFVKKNIHCFTSKNYIDNKKQLIKESLFNKNEVLIFNIFWSSEYDFILEHCQKSLSESSINKSFDKFNKYIKEFEETLNFQIPFEKEDYDFYFEDDIIHSILNIFLCDPADENDDGIKILLFKDTNDEEIKKETIKFLNYIYRTYFNHIYETNNFKEYSELSFNEKELIKLLVY